MTSDSNRPSDPNTYNDLIDDGMATSPPGSWPVASQDIEKPDPFESIQPGAKATHHISGHGHGHGGEVDEFLPKRKGTAERIAMLPPEILEQ